MICQKCKQNLPEQKLESSHDVPCYLFKGYKRNIRKNQADKFKRHWLCIPCHREYEDGLRLTLIIQCTKFSTKFFKRDNGQSI